MAVDFNANAQIRSLLPSPPSAENSYIVLRASKYGELAVNPVVQTAHTLSNEGSYYTASNPTPGTGIAFAVSAAVSETAGNFLHIVNNDTIKSIHLHYIRLICTAVPASGVSGHFFVKTDAVSRYTSGGSPITPVNANSGIANGSIASVYAGAITTVAASSKARQITRGVLRSVIPVVNDEWLLSFGSIEMNGNNSSLGGAVAERMAIPCPPVTVAPGHSVSLQLWFPSNAATPASFEFDLGMFERAA